jgi:hypothetical protein
MCRSISLTALQAMGISIVAHFSRLIPLLVSWTTARDSDTRRAALDFLMAVVCVSWPRIQDHASLLWKYIERGNGEARQLGKAELELRKRLGEALQCAQFSEDIEVA